MGCEVSWYDEEKTILLAVIAKDTTWPDYHLAIDSIVKHAASIEHRVDIIFLDDVGMPAGNPFPHLRQGIGKLIKQPNIHLSIIAGSRGSTGFVRAAFEALGRAFARTTRIDNGQSSLFARDMTEAVERIQQDRSKKSVPQVTEKSN